jgi:kumamolisin
VWTRAEPNEAKTAVNRITLKGSERAAMSGARIVSPADPAEQLQVTVVVRRRAREDFERRVAALASGARQGSYLTRAQFAELYGADPADLAAVRAFATAHGLTVALEHAARRTLLLSGSVAQFSKAFTVELHRMAHPGGSYRGRTGAVQLPAELGGIVEAVLGLDDRPQAKTHFRLRTAGEERRRHKAQAAVSYQPPQVASLYAFPAGTGQGQCVGLIELGGGFVASDLDTYFSGLNITPPKVTAVSVDQATNSPTGSADGPDGEVMLDIEMVGSIAPQTAIAVYFAPNTDAGFLDAITSAIHDTGNQPAVISISWGGAESTWTAQAMTAMDEAFQAALTLGITVCIASGDNGSSDGVSSGEHVDFPASSPHVLACGGTSMRGAKTIASEVVWNDGGSGGASGGGVSSFFALPSWQAGLQADASGKSSALTMRGVPDVAGDADPDTGYEVRIDGTDTVIGGTSAVAPLWAALIARINQTSGKSAGFINSQLYQNPQTLRDITQGNNGGFQATVGWDACTGLGSPNGSLLGAIL